MVHQKTHGSCAQDPNPLNCAILSAEYPYKNTGFWGKWITCNELYWRGEGKVLHFF